MHSSSRRSPCSVQAIWIFVSVAFLQIGLATGLTHAQDDPLLPPMLEEQLLKEDAAELAAAARQLGDPSRGAILFYQPYLSCTKCHSMDEATTPLGPDLTKPNEEATDQYLVEALLQPSKAIKKGYEPMIVITDKGKAITGLLVEENDDGVVLRDPAKEDEIISIPDEKVDEVFPGKLSVMPAGLTNALASREQFLDLVRYLMEIVEKGPKRARQLEPPAHLYALPPIPEYEKDIDHAGMIADLDDESFARGRAIYDRLCVNCHGTRDQPGSLPTSLRFATGKFKHGFDPHTMYQTLTKGYGMMMPQTWMVPQQKYDVIHYVRQAYLKEHNPTQYASIDPEYLAQLPEGASRGPEPSIMEPWVTMDYGPNLNATYEVGDDGTNFAYKGIAVRLDPGPGGVSRGRYWMLYEHDTLRAAAAWSGEGFIDWNAIMMNGKHGVHPRLVGQVHMSNPTGPGWGDPADGSFEDTRLRGRDDRHYGPLPRVWAQYKGMYHYGNRVILAYTVGQTEILEMPGVEALGDSPVFTRTLNIGPRKKALLLQVARHPRGKGFPPTEHDTTVVVLGQTHAAPEQEAGAPLHLDGATGVWIAAGLVHYPAQPKWQVTAGGDLRLQIPAGNDSLKFMLWCQSAESADQINAPAVAEGIDEASVDLEPLTRGGPPRWQERLTTKGTLGQEEGPFAVDVLTHPARNPWLCQTRFTGFDFFPDGNRAAICSWDGDVWMVRGIDRPEAGLSWQRIASGMFQPLGLKIVDGQIYVTCRDQICILRDKNGDGETDFYECFNSDHQVTEHFHEFAMGLQIDSDGNFYYAKGARHAKTALVPHHGTLLRVSKDGRQTDILARGFRAPNGVCINPERTLFVTDQEGHWMPKNRINLITDEGGIFGNHWGYHDLTDPADELTEPPVCWITNSMDRSPSELIWTDSDAWGPLKGTLLNTSYGYGMIYTVPHETVDGRMQGGVCPLPLKPFPTGTMRPRFHPQNGQLYICGMFAWAGNQHEPGGFFRVRYTGRPVYLPTGLQARKRGMAVTFSDALDRESATDAESFAVQTWTIRRSGNYGSDHYDEKRSDVTNATLSEDGKTVFLEIPDIKPTRCMEIKYWLKGADGQEFNGTIHNTIHKLGAG